MLDPSLKTQVENHLRQLRHPVVLAAVVDESARAEQVKGFLEEVAALSARVEVSSRPATAGERAPVFFIHPAGDPNARVAFAGLPLGHEFTSFILALLQVGGHPVRLDEGTASRVRALKGPLAFETFVSLSCQNCPDVVQALNAMAVLNPAISHVAIDGAWFQEEADARAVLAVPSLFLDAKAFAQGRTSLEEILDQLSSSAEVPSDREPYDVLVVGGGPAGVASAIYAARKGIRVGLVADRLGGQVLDTQSIENHIATRSTTGPRLATDLESHLQDYQVDLIRGKRVESLVPEVQEGFREVRLTSGEGLRARTVIVATGAQWRNLNVPGEQEHRNKGVTYCPHCDGPLFKGKRVAVVGGGNSGVEAAIDLAGLASAVTLVEFDDRLRADAVLQAKLNSLPNTQVITGALTQEVIGRGGRVAGLHYEDRKTGAQERLDVEGVFVQIGLLPSTDWLRESGVKLSPRGEVEVDSRGQTSLPGVFAAGDCTTVPYKQIVVAVGQGATAALSAFDDLMRSAPPGV